MVCSSSFTYRSRPTASMCPLCSPPSRLPAPRSSRSRAAMRKPAPELGELADGGQPLARDLGQHRVRRHQQVRVGAAVRAADAAAELVELGEAVAVGAVHDHGVGAGDVEAVLDDGGGHQHVRAALHEGEHGASPAPPPASGRGRPPPAPPAPASGPCWPASRSTPRGCGRSRPARRGPAPGGWRWRSRRWRTSRSRSGWPGGPWAGSRSRTCRGSRPAPSAACAGWAWRRG